MKHFFIYFLISSIALAVRVQAFEIKVVGTDLLDATLQQPLTEFAESHKDWTLNLDLYGSIPALERLKAGQADLAIVAIPDDSPKPAEDYQVVPFAFQVAVVIVKDINPLVEIDFSQLKGIYGISSDVNYGRWNEMGLTGLWSNRPIQALALSNEDSVVFELFKYKALNQSPLKPNVSLAASERELFATMETDSAAIAVIDHVPDSDTYRALPVGTGKAGEFAFGPTPDNVFYGDYALRLPIYLVFKEEKKLKIKDILYFLLSKEVEEILDGEGFMALPENVRRRTVLELDIES